MIRHSHPLLQNVPMLDYQRDFIDFAMQCGVLRFGQFTLKSGRVSPYFFNAGLFNSGAALGHLGAYYAAAICHAGLEFDVLFGPAYKGIPLVAATAIALAQQTSRDIAWCFNRKEAKDHGEGGVIVGAPLQGRVLILDDVITAGTAIRETMHILQQQPAQAIGVMLALDRQERGHATLSAVQEVEQNYQMPVSAIVSLAELIAYLSERPAHSEHLAQMQRYREQFGIAV